MSAASPTTEASAPHSRRTERLWDVAALAVMTGGAALFFFARHALQSISAGTYDFPVGMSAVTRTDVHVLQSNVGMALVGVGLAVGVASAVRFGGARDKG